MSISKIKIIALVLMTIDHIAEFITGTPIWFHWIGRIVAPLFIYCVVVGVTKTHNLKRYLLRLYVAGIIMGVVQSILNIDNNFFRTLFLIAVIVSLIELKKHDNKAFVKKMWIYIAWQIGAIALIILAIAMFSVQTDVIVYLGAPILGSLFYTEGGLVYIALGVLFYYTMQHKAKLSAWYIGFSAVFGIVTLTNIIPRVLGKMAQVGLRGVSNVIEYILDTIVRISPMAVGGSPFTQNYQWMIVFALPLLLLYNGEKGKGYKYLFYAYYPIHIIVLYIIGKFILA